MKWGTVYALAAEAPSAIVYVPMLTPDVAPREALVLSAAGPIAAPVLAHFREARRAREIAWPTGMPFDAVEGPMIDRPAYFQEARTLVAHGHERSDRRVVVGTRTAGGTSGQ